MRLGFLAGRASVAELRAALDAGKEPPTAGKPGGRVRAQDTREGGESRSTRSVGRPPAAGQARSVELRVRVSPGEMTELERRAKVAGWSLSEWVRACLLGEP